MRNGTVQKKARGALRLVESRPSGRVPPAVDYYSRMEEYAHRIRRTSEVQGIIRVLDEALRETRALHTVDEVSTAREQLLSAERKIQELKGELELVNQLVREDQLTGALNRRGLDDALAREAARCERRHSPLCVALLDLDDFKRLNDNFGHPAGDAVLVHVVGVMRGFVRSHDLIGRFGGEEFMLVLPDSGLEESIAVMQRLSSGLAARPLAWGSSKLAVSFSAGIAERRAGENAAALVGRADAAMYEAKHLGKARTQAAR